MVFSPRSYRFHFEAFGHQAATKTISHCWQGECASMAATKNVPHLRSVRNFAQPCEEAPPAPQPVPETIRPRHGVVTLYGYGIKVHVDRGHLTLEDGIGRHRRIGRFARVNHDISRLVVIGSDGMVSLGALAGWPVKRLHS
jgi:hypothetical protein